MGKINCLTDTNIKFRAHKAEMKRMGLIFINHYQVINEADQTKLYTSMLMNPETPLGIANQVQFGIKLFFFRRGMVSKNEYTQMPKQFRNM